MELVACSVADGVATVMLNRPERLNAWTPALGTAYFDRLEQAVADPEVRAIVVTGAGRGFCAGADMDDLGTIGGGELPTFTDTRPQTLPMTLPKPVIAAVNGPCAGLGMVIAAACDRRFAAAGAKFTTAFARRGLIAEHGLSWLLVRLAGIPAALDLLLTARTFLAEEALELGVVDQVVAPADLLPAARAYARELATWSSPTSMAVIKAQVLADLQRPLAEGYAAADALMLASLERADLAEGVASFVERRPPRFAPVDVEALRA